MGFRGFLAFCSLCFFRLCSSFPYSKNSRAKMESREDLKSILPFLPLILLSSSICWPSKTVESLKVLSRGPQFSEVDSGAILFDAIVALRDSIGLSKERLSQYTADGYALFFDDLIDRLESRKWFGEVVPFLASLLLRLPSLLEDHYRISDGIFSKENNGSTTRTGLRVLDSQEAGVVFMSQELIGALLACSFFCLFPTFNRGSKHLPSINFDNLFSKVLSLKRSLGGTIYPDADFWNKSVSPLCSFKVSNSGLIEDQHYEALEIDFANKYIGGGALSAGCVQVVATKIVITQKKILVSKIGIGTQLRAVDEEIRFMVNPESIISMLFLSSMDDNEAIEIIGAERFSKYTGYGSSFCFSGDYLDKKPIDPIGRRKTRIVAIDALCYPGMMQYRVEGLLRICLSGEKSGLKIAHHTVMEGDDSIPISTGTRVVDTSHCPHFDERLKPPAYFDPDVASTERTNGFDEHSQGLGNEENIGVATGNWGCGAFGGNPELKSTIQWLAASQAQRPFILYFTFNDTALRRLEERSKGQTDAGRGIANDSVLQHNPEMVATVPCNACEHLIVIAASSLVEITRAL
ncbi:hypothetical protein ACLOJK_011638 [Asimina triloba]